MSEAIEAGLATPVETNEAAQPAATPDNVAAPVETTQDQPDVKTEAATKTFTQDELNEIIQKEKAKAEAKAERRALKAYRETLERFAPPKQEQQSPVNDSPKRDQYATDEEWLDARDSWRDDRRDQAVKAERQQQQAKTMAEKTESFYSEAEKIQGFDREAFDDLPLTQTIAAALVESDAPAKLMAHMAAHPDEVARIAGLSPARQAAEIGKLEMKLASVPKVSSAPAPIKPIGSRGSATNSDPAKASMEEYMAIRKSQGARWAR